MSYVWIQMYFFDRVISCGHRGDGDVSSSVAEPKCKQIFSMLVRLVLTPEERWTAEAVGSESQHL